MKRIRLLLTLVALSLCSWQKAWADLEVTVSINVPGQLGVEILRQIGDNSITDVTALTVTGGTMNEDDWKVLQGLTSLETLDLKQASSKDMPARQFLKSSSDVSAKSLVTVKLPSDLETIGQYAFGYQSDLESVELPSTLKSLGERAFEQCEKLSSLGITALPSGITVIPNYCFCVCRQLQPFTIPEGVTEIGYQAFAYCKEFSSTLPSTLKKIDSFAFDNAGMTDVSVVIPEGCEFSGYHTFYSTNIKSISLPTTFYKVVDYYTINNCTNLTDVYIKSPTILSNNSGFLSGCSNANLRVHVPAHLLAAYKLDNYFKDFTIVGDATDDFTGWWTVNAPLALSSNRMAGTPNIILTQRKSSSDPTITLTVDGDNAQTFGNVITYGHTGYYYHWDKYAQKDWSMILNTADNVTISGTYEHKIGTYEKQWYFFCLPFDFKVSDITTENDVKFAIRYYDGDARAASGTGSSWKNFASDATVPAGTGFIYQTSQSTTTTFKALNNATKNNVMSNKDFTKALTAHNSSDAANKGWNLVGNPWLSYYNIHDLGFTAPISVWTGSTYEAYSIEDDDYAIRPNEAFFVQKPDQKDEITFPIRGRQLTEEITHQNGVRRRTEDNATRRLVDVQIEAEQQKDKTRVVISNEASAEYETSCDASKFISMDANVPQIYTLDATDTQYAINERPLGNGEVRLGVVIRNAGQHTITAVRNTMGRVLLRDNETGITTDLQQNGYVFNAKAGYDENRFTLSFADLGTTGIDETLTNADESEEVFTMDGRRANNARKGVYIVRKGQKTQKMIVK